MAQETDEKPADSTSAAQYTPSTDVRSATLSSSNTPQSDYGLNPPSARSGGFPDYLSRQAQYHHAPSSHPGSVASMAQATSPSRTLQDGKDHISHKSHLIESDNELPLDPTIAQSSPTYPPPYSPYNPQGHDMTHYQGQPPPAMYGRPEWPPQYAHQHGMPGPYSSPATTVSTSSPAVSAGGSRPGQVRDIFTLGDCDKALIGSFHSSTPLSRFPAPNSTSAPDADMKKSKECTNVDGMAVKKHMGP